MIWQTKKCASVGRLPPHHCAPGFTWWSQKGGSLGSLKMERHGLCSFMGTCKQGLETSLQILCCLCEGLSRFPQHSLCLPLFSSLGIAAVVIWVIFVIRNTKGTIYSVCFHKTLIRGCWNVTAKSLKQQQSSLWISYNVYRAQES